MMHTSYEEYHQQVIRFVLKELEQGKEEDLFLDELCRHFTLEEQEAQWAIEMTKTGMFRVAVIAGAKGYPASNIDSDPYLLAAMAEARERAAAGTDSSFGKANAMDDKSVTQFYAKENRLAVRQEAILKLAQDKSEQLVKVLRDALEEENNQIRVVALRAIRRNCIRELYGAMIALYDREDNYAISYHATNIIKDQQLQAAIPALMKKISSVSPLLQSDAISTLGVLRAKVAKAAITPFLNSNVLPVVEEGDSEIKITHRLTLGQEARKALQNMRWRLSDWLGEH